MFRLLQGNPKKELLRGLWVTALGLYWGAGASGGNGTLRLNGLEAARLESGLGFRVYRV